MEATKCSNALPAAGEDYEYNSSFPEFQDSMNHEQTRVLNMIQTVMRYHGLRGNILANREMVEEQLEVLVEANDQLVEKVGILLDEASGIKKDASLVVVSRTPKQLQQPVSSWNKKITPTSGSKLTNYSLMSAKNIERPQQSFREKVDNSHRPFVPKIKEKPNALKSLQESMAFSLPEGQDIDSSFVYPHPYQYELDNFEPDESLLKRVIAQVPRDLDATPLTLISTVEGLNMLCEKLKLESEFSIDLEHHSFRSFLGFTCLMQISTRLEDFIVDTLALRDSLIMLNVVFTDPKIVKVLHGADSDIQWLQKDFGLYIVNMFDTSQASRVLGFSHFSLAYLLEHYCKVQADKQYQMADWRIRPLPEELIKYAREDTHYLLYIYDCIRNDLLYRGNGQSNLLLSVIQNSTNICKKRYQKQPRFTENGHKELYFNSQSRAKVKKELNSRQSEALKSLYTWRDKIAREEDESTGYILPNHMMFQMAEYLPKEPEGLLACCKPVPPFVRTELLTLHRFIQDARDLPLVKQNTPRSELMPSKLQHPKFYVNSLLHRPHDLSHPIPENETVQRSNAPNLKSSSDLFGGSGFVKPLQMKKVASINLCDNIENIPHETAAQKRAAEIQATFVNPFIRYLPTEHVARTTWKQPSATDDSEMKSPKWKLLPNTKPVVAPKVNPVVQVIETSAKLNFNESEEEQTPEPTASSTTIREQLSSDRKRKMETADILESPFSSLLKKKSKKEEKKEAKKELKRATKEGEFQPYDYEKVDYDKLLKGEVKPVASEPKKKKKKEFNPSSNLTDSDHKAVKKPYHGSGSKSMTYSSKSSDSNTPKIHWPKR